MNNKFTSAFILIFFLSLGFITAQGFGVPHQFYGSATYNGAAANGLSVDAYIDGIKVGNTTTLNGKYGYSPIFLIKDPNGLYEGKTIKFYLNGIDTGQTYNFFNGESTKLDLAANGAPPSPPSGGGGSSGGSSGGGGGGGSSTTSTGSKTTGAATTPTNTQTTTSANETQPEITPIDENKGLFSGITGAVTGVIGSPLGIGVLIFILAIVGIYIYAFIMRKRAENRK